MAYSKLIYPISHEDFHSHRYVTEFIGWGMMGHQLGKKNTRFSDIQEDQEELDLGHP